jgi:hypothetical protein
VANLHNRPLKSELIQDIGAPLNVLAIVPRKRTRLQDSVRQVAARSIDNIVTLRPRSGPRAKRKQERAA